MRKVVDEKKTYRHLLPKTLLGAAALLSMCVPGAAKAADRDPLLDVLINKGILTQQEAVQVQQEAAQKQEEMVKDIQKKSVPKALQGLKFEALGYIDYSAGKSGGTGDTQSSYNKFSLTRGYLGVKKDITPWLGGRITTDITRDASSSWETRIKYLYAYFKPGNFGFLTDTTGELGQGHIPWLDFEEHVNPYRCQDNMFIEKAGVLNSADIGASLQGNLGGKLADAKARTGNSHYAGRYGSWHVGVYNGGGYHADEKNGNKPIEGRLTVRPLPDTLPGLQLSYFGVTGKGNTVDSPDYTANLEMVSYEHPDFILTGQYLATKGNAGGSWVFNNEALDTAGYSFFGAYHLPTFERKLSLFARYDHFDNDASNDVAAGDDATYDMYIAGLSYNIYKGNMVVLDYEAANYGNDSGGIGKAPSIGNNLGDDHKVQLVYQFQF